jgi:hypothetical protein
MRLAHEDIELIAARVVELLRGVRMDSELVDAAEVARRLGVSRESVYEHADALGAIRVGNGVRPRLRFDLALVAERLRPQSPAKPEPTTAKARRPRPGRDAELLPIRERRAA